jgi:hypothetical protein
MQHAGHPVADSWLIYMLRSCRALGTDTGAVACCLWVVGVKVMGLACHKLERAFQTTLTPSTTGLLELS